MAMWLAAFETWAVARLLRSPTFHSVVRKAHKRVHEARHGKDPSEMGGTNIDDPNKSSRFIQYLKDEIKDQFWGKSPPRK
ncbi:hypothetical protein SBOR_5526 [Sclerotinia borealis F-4128]|uniref:Uncharacterized protein n=1 Tax=Sclerotinia borealis (strain F-4128) TaxID=1432307 RepID=W9CE15_SCLBF|nr:hypothetical protein SBOR_5526 [Sclerotinia borealis F-4128]